MNAHILCDVVQRVYRIQYLHHRPCTVTLLKHLVFATAQFRWIMYRHGVLVEIEFVRVKHEKIHHQIGNRSLILHQGLIGQRLHKFENEQCESE